MKLLTKDEELRLKLLDIPEFFSKELIDYIFRNINNEEYSPDHNLILEVLQKFTITFEYFNFKEYNYIIKEEDRNYFLEKLYEYLNKNDIEFIDNNNKMKLKFLKIKKYTTDFGVNIKFLDFKYIPFAKRIKHFNLNNFKNFFHLYFKYSDLEYLAKNNNIDLEYLTYLYKKNNNNNFFDKDNKKVFKYDFNFSEKEFEYFLLDKDISNITYFVQDKDFIKNFFNIFNKFNKDLQEEILLNMFSNFFDINYFFEYDNIFEENIMYFFENIKEKDIKFLFSNKNLFILFHSIFYKYYDTDYEIFPYEKYKKIISKIYTVSKNLKNEDLIDFENYKYLINFFKFISNDNIFDISIMDFYEMKNLINFEIPKDLYTENLLKCGVVYKKNLENIFDFDKLENLDRAVAEQYYGYRNFEDELMSLNNNLEDTYIALNKEIPIKKLNVIKKVLKNKNIYLDLSKYIFLDNQSIKIIKVKSMSEFNIFVDNILKDKIIINSKILLDFELTDFQVNKIEEIIKNKLKFMNFEDADSSVENENYWQNQRFSHFLHSNIFSTNKNIQSKYIKYLNLPKKENKQNFILYYLKEEIEKVTNKILTENNDLIIEEFIKNYDLICYPDSKDFYNKGVDRLIDLLEKNLNFIFNNHTNFESVFFKLIEFLIEKTNETKDTQYYKSLGIFLSEKIFQDKIFFKYSEKILNILNKFSNLKKYLNNYNSTNGLGFRENINIEYFSDKNYNIFYYQFKEKYLEFIKNEIDNEKIKDFLNKNFYFFNEIDDKYSEYFNSNLELRENKILFYLAFGQDRNIDDFLNYAQMDLKDKHQILNLEKNYIYFKNYFSKNLNRNIKDIDFVQIISNIKCYSQNSFENLKNKIQEFDFKKYFKKINNVKNTYSIISVEDERCLKELTFSLDYNTIELIVQNLNPLHNYSKEISNLCLSFLNKENQIYIQEYIKYISKFKNEFNLFFSNKLINRLMEKKIEIKDLSKELLMFHSSNYIFENKKMEKLTNNLFFNSKTYIQTVKDDDLEEYDKLSQKPKNPKSQIPFVKKYIEINDELYVYEYISVFDNRALICHHVLDCCLTPSGVASEILPFISDFDNQEFSGMFLFQKVLDNHDLIKQALDEYSSQNLLDLSEYNYSDVQSLLVENCSVIAGAFTYKIDDKIIFDNIEVNRKNFVTKDGKTYKVNFIDDNLIEIVKSFSDEVFDFGFSQVNLGTAFLDFNLNSDNEEVDSITSKVKFKNEPNPKNIQHINNKIYTDAESQLILFKKKR